ncbi:MAG: hypothetical protein WBB23_10680 [Desulforhopalus sp.]
MKSKIITAVVATALIVGFSAMNASAWNWGHQGQMMEHGMMNGGAYNANLSQEALNEINKIKIKIAADQAELNVLMSSASPDTQRIRTLAEQISTSQLDLQKKYGAAGSGYGHGMMGSGMMHGGSGMMHGGYGCC